MAMTIGEARAIVQRRIDEGDKLICPCCSQTCKKYSRSIYGKMAMVLHHLYLAEDGLTPQQITMKVKLSGGGDHAKLSYWGLVVQGEENKRWYITHKGKQFLSGNISVPYYCFTYNARIHGFSKRQVNIRDIARRFDLEDTLNPDNLFV